MFSRDYLIGQAVTETAAEYFPWSFGEGGSEKALRTAMYCGESQIMNQTWAGFCRHVRAKFKEISSREVIT